MFIDSLRAGSHFHCYIKMWHERPSRELRVGERSEPARGLAREMRACKDAIVFPFRPLERCQDFDNLLFECVKLLANRI